MLQHALLTSLISCEVNFSELLHFNPGKGEENDTSLHVEVSLTFWTVLSEVWRAVGCQVKHRKTSRSKAAFSQQPSLGGLRVVIHEPCSHLTGVLPTKCGRLSVSDSAGSLNTENHYLISRSFLVAGQLKCHGFRLCQSLLLWYKNTHYCESHLSVYYD